MGDALAHSVLPGVVLAYVSGQSILGGALLAALLTVAMISLISRQKRLSSDTAIGVVFTGAFATGVVIMSRLQGYTRDLAHFLFGNILAVGRHDLAFSGLVCVLVLACLVLFHRELLIVSFDPTHATKMGISVATMRFGLLVLIAITVVSGIQAVGVILVTSLLVTPAATARLVTGRLTHMMALSAFFGILSAILGLYASYFLAVAAGASIVLAGSLLFAMVWLATWLRFLACG